MYFENFKPRVQSGFFPPTITSKDPSMSTINIIVLKMQHLNLPRKHPAVRVNQYSQWWSINAVAGLHGLSKNRLWLTLSSRCILDCAQRFVHKCFFQRILGLSRMHSGSRCSDCVGWKDWRHSSDICYLNRWERAVRKSSCTQRSAIKLDKNTQLNTFRQFKPNIQVILSVDNTQVGYKNKILISTTAWSEKLTWSIV